MQITNILVVVLGLLSRAYLHRASKLAANIAELSNPHWPLAVREGLSKHSQHAKRFTDNLRRYRL